VGDWRYELVSFGGHAVELLSPRGRGLSLDLEAAGSARYGLSAAEADALHDVMQPGRVDVLVTEAGAPRFRGPLTGVQGSDLTVAAGSLSFAAVGLAELLADRFIPAGRELAATELTTAAWTLIADTQALTNGDLGIVAGALPDVGARTKRWDSATPVLTGIRELADLDPGFEWAVEPDADGIYTFDTWSPRRGDETGVVLDTRNIAAASPTWDAGAGAVCNHAQVVGVNAVSVTDEDADSQVLYRRRERSTSIADADDATVLGDRAARELRDAVVRPAAGLRLLPGADQTSLDDLGLGDVVTVEFRAGWARLSGLHRITRLEVAIPDGGGAETITATVEPWDG
jgi:hypothetical protein